MLFCSGVKGGVCVVSADLSGKTGDDLRVISEAVIRMSRLLHEHSQKLEIAVEGKFANESGDPRVRLLSDALHVSRVADLELGRIYQAMQRTVKASQALPKVSVAPPIASNGTFEREREALIQERDELETLSEIARTLNSTLEFDKVLSLVMDRVIQFVKAERGVLVLVQLSSEELEFSIARDKNANTIPESAFATAQVSRNTIKRVIRTGTPMLTDDAQADDMLKAQESIMAFGIRSIMCAPLIVRDHCIGAVYVDSRFNTRLFHSKHLELLLAFCNQAAIAIENARLFADLNKAIRTVREDKQYMDNIFGSIANGVITTNAEGMITTFNAAASIILHIHPDRALGKHYREAFQMLPLNMGIIDTFTNVQVKHENGTLIKQAIDCRVPGREREDIISLNYYVSSLRDMQGAHIGMALVIDDQTELKRSEARVKQVRSIFERYVHPNVVEQLIRDPMALKLGGETKEISVVFADIRGYTRLSESMAPEDVMHLINRYLKIMCDAIWEESGTLTAFQGDALMAIFNAPLAQSDHALRAVRAAWKMRLAVLDYQHSQPQETQVSFGIGVNTGLATVGNVGAQERLQNYTAIGDAVNVASRLQNNVTDNNILLNDLTFQQVAPQVRTGRAFSLSVKNKSAPLTVRYLMGVL
jgi:adenylate cyclase